MSVSRPLVVGTVYVSEEVVREVCSSARLLSTFEDAAYGRSSYCFGGAPQDVQKAVVGVALNAFERLDMRTHRGSHPTLGVVDHVSVFPLGSTPMVDAVETARAIGADLASQVPILFYGKINDRSLAETRRQTSYFSPGKDISLQVEADLNGPQTDKLGVCLVGATQHVLNYNVEVSGDIKAARRIAKAIRAKDGGLPGVEALALPKLQQDNNGENSFEIACNLLDVDRSPPSAVLAEITAAANTEHITVLRDYVIGPTKHQMLQDLLQDSLLLHDEQTTKDHDFLPGSSWGQQDAKKKPPS